MALLNVFRNYRRSLITLSAIILGCTALILFAGFINSMYQGMRENLIHSQLGHIQIYAKGYNKNSASEPEKYLLDSTTVSKVQDILEADADVLLVTERLNFNGLISNGSQSVAVVGEGIVPDKEALLSSAVSLKQGDDLFSDDTYGSLVGDGLFNGLSANVGEYLTILSSTADGAINAIDVQVTGVVSTGVREVDARFIRANLSLIQELLYTDKVSRMVVLLNNTDDTDKVFQKLEQIFEEHDLNIEMRTWSQLAGYYHEVVGLFNSIFQFIKIIVLFIVALSIANTMLMAVMERTREIGTIRAIGGTPLSVMNLLLSEAAIIGLIGSTLGIACGWFGAEMLNHSGWMMPTPPGSSQSYPIRIIIEQSMIVETFLIALGVAVASSIYPAFKATRLSVADALRFV